ncbi:MAG: hypothetical protein R3F49_06400 [Planctomycetota bacterium]
MQRIASQPLIRSTSTCALLCAVHLALVSDAPARDLRPAPGAAPHPAALSAAVFDDTSEAGVIWAAGANWKARFDAAGLTFLPRLGKSAPESAPTRFTLARVTSGGEDLPVTAATVARRANEVVLTRGSLSERYDVTLDGLYQSFVFETLPTSGDLSVELAVDSPWTAVPGEETLRFVHQAYGAVSYGRAWVIDARGARAELARAWTGSAITLTVPASFLATAVLPLTIDPLIGAQLHVTGSTQDEHDQADAVWIAGTNELWVSWSEYVSATDKDVFVTSFDAAGVQGSTVAIDLSTNYWDTPVIAGARGTYDAMVVASQTVNGPGTSTATIMGRPVAATTRVAGPIRTIASLGASCVHPDIGGSNSLTAPGAAYCVVWEVEVSATDRDIMCQALFSDGSAQGAPLPLAHGAATDDRAPAISKSRGNELLTGRVWNVAWIRDTNLDGKGQPRAVRVLADGSGVVAPNFEVPGLFQASHLDVSSTFDETYPGFNIRPFVVVAEQELFNSDIWAAVCANDFCFGARHVSDMEDYDLFLPRHAPSVATDGTSFYIAYEEEAWNATPGSGDFDVRVLAGALAFAQANTTVAIAERHMPVALGAGYQGRVSITTRWDGGASTDTATLVWQDEAAPGGQRIGVQSYESPTVFGSSEQAFGVQYCAAQSHFGSADGGRVKSFISAIGDASLGSTQRLVCTDMTPNAYGYFIVSDMAGDVQHAGGGAGHLCLGGAIGRGVGGAILFSGSAGTISATFDPTQLPSPTGPFAALPGVRMHFQCWHRDLTSGGTPTSNFSNACAVWFRP